MQTTVSKRGQTVIPAAIRRRYGIEEGSKLAWLDDGEGIHVIPVPPDPVAALYGRGRGERLVEKLLAERRAEAARERQ